MSAAIEPGMWVECIGACGCHDSAWHQVALFLDAGRVYMVTDVGVTIDRPTEAALKVSTYPDLVFCIDHFRPIYGGKSEIIEALKQPAPDREREDA